MTKKDYVLIARGIRLVKHDPEVNTTRESNKAIFQTMYRIAVELENENPRFNRERFYEACGFNYTEVRMAQA